MRLLDPLFTTDRMREIFSDASRLQRMLDFEGALGRALAGSGVVPQSSVVPIEVHCKSSLFPQDAIARAADLAGNLAIPVVKELTALVAQFDEKAAGFVHLGATSQDAIDTGLILQLRDAFDDTEGELARLASALQQLTEAHKHTLLAGRTWMQQASPITLGLKFAGWLDAVERHRERFGETRNRVEVLQFGGAVGSLAALGTHGEQVSAVLASELKLGLPDMSWHAQRDRFAEVATVYGVLAGTLGKIARDISLMSQTEVGELSEPSAPERGRSSTLPHKRNPVGCSVVLAAAIRVPGLVSTMLAAMVQEHERGLGGWQAEWETLPEICLLTAGALSHLIQVLEGLEIHKDAMARNLNVTQGVLMAEAVAMALAKQIGKMPAHQLVERASQRAVESGEPFREVLVAAKEVTRHLSASEIDTLLDPRNYTGSAQAMIDRVLSASKKSSHGTLIREVEMFHVEINGARLHYRFDGPEDAPVIVLSNSLGTDLHMWDSQIPALSEKFRVLRYDSRGHGRSTVTAGPYTVDMLGNDVVGLLDELHIDRICFCGLSLGGIIAQWLGVNAANRLNRIVACDTAAKIGNAEFWNKRIAAVRAGGMAAIAGAQALRWFTEPYVAEYPQLIEAMKQGLLRTPADGYIATCEALRDSDLRESIRRIKTPTLVITGAHDAVTPPTDGKFIAAQIPGARYVEVNGSHLSNIEDSSGFSAALLQFLLQTEVR